MQDIRVYMVLLASGLLIFIAGMAAMFGSRYQIVSATAADGSSFVWRLDTRSGEVETCNYTKITGDPFEALAKKDAGVPPFNIHCTSIYKP